MQAITVGIGTYSFAFFVVPWMNEFGALRSTLMMAASGLALATAVASPICGMWLDRYPDRSLIMGSGISFCVALLAIAGSPSATIIVGVYVLVMPFGMILAGSLMASSLVTRHFEAGRGTALGICALGTSLGGFVLPPVITVFIAESGWRSLFVLLALVVCVLVVLPAPLLLKRQDRTAANIDSGTHPGDMSLMRSPAVLKLGLSFVAPVALFMAALHNLGAMAVDLGIEQQRAAWIASTTSIAMMLSKVVAGVLCDRVPQKPLYVGIILISALGLGCMRFADSYRLLFVGVCLLGVGAGSCLPVITSAAATHWGKQHFGKVMGVVFAMAGASGLGSLIAGIIRDVGGSYGDAFLILGLLVIPAIWCFVSFTNAIDAGVSERPPTHSG